jgi:general secretion pathway protein D
MSRKSKKRIRAAAALLLSILLMPGPALGQAGGAAPDEEEVMYYPAPKFINAQLDFVMAQYGTLTGRSPMIAPGLSKSITFRSQTELTREEYIDAIESILAMNDIALVPYGEKFVKVVPAAEARRHAMETQTHWDKMPPDNHEMISRLVVLKHMEINEAQVLADTFKSRAGKVDPVPRVNGLLITDSSAHVERILEVMQDIDQPLETREQVIVRPIRFAKPSEIRAKLAEIIEDLKQKENATPTVAFSAPSGPPGVRRALRTTTTTSSSPTVEVEGGLIRGAVRMVADDRTGILIFITMPDNMEFFDDIVNALDIETTPDVRVQVFRLEFADAESVAGMLNQLIGAKLGQDTGTGSPAAAETDTGSRALREYVRRVTGAPAETESSAPQPGRLSAENVKILADKRTNALIVMARKADITAIAEIVRDMDIMLSQVLVEAVIIEVKLSDSLQSGVDWLQHSMLAYNKDHAPIMAFTGGGGGGTLTPKDATGGDTASGPGGLTYFFSHFGLNIDAVVNLASDDEETRVISTPVILTTDNEEATLRSTEAIYVYKGKKYDQQQNVYDDYETRDVGLTLTVKPQINTNKVVMMTITQTMSEPGAVGEPQSGAKVSSERSLEAKICVGDGETIILGGLVRKDLYESRSKIPILGDIPLLGRLFNSTTTSEGRTELIVLVTPYVLDTPEQIAAESARRKRALDLEGMWKRDWSDSQFAEPTKEQLREQKRAERREAREARRSEKERAARETEENPKTGPETENRTESTESSPSHILALLEEGEARWRESLDKVDEEALLTGKAE